ncbi:hypothetical protein TRFO_13589 [Tritrichomonas foetus]|uniref:Uncharacterized protein n=1 Tax=Tritrichomonas foetus TaxID=1144522 RepID=A0A1J4KXM5_9EUKA|nr:hypothetical protein TRFO_13589 [Tritrichomonas foetus]|eukprot:OHT15930.1 hypothetical protein TRFO_13589 [Tritrichomonas foetus]
MTDDHLKWLRGPLPPLSDSILSSGLVNDSSLQNQSNHLQQAVFGSSKKNVQKKAKKPLKQPVIDPKPKKEKNKFVAAPTQPTLPPSDIPSSYKPPPVEQIFEQTRSKSAFSRPPLFGEPKKQNLRQEIATIVYSLDSSIAEIAPTTATSLTPEEHSEFISKMLQLYNYHFNQLVLTEKDNSSDYALLLRRFQQFYNQIISDIPSLRASFEGEIEELKNQIIKLNNELEEEKTLRNISEKKNMDLEKTSESQKQQINEINQESQEKDIKIQTISDDNDFQKSQINQLNFKITNLTEEIDSLKKAIIQRDEEIRIGLEQNEENMKILAKFQEGETGYIVVYHEEKIKRENAESKIKELQQQIHDLMNIPKSDKSVNTTDLPQQKIKKRRGKGVNDSKSLNKTNSGIVSSSPSYVLSNSGTSTAKTSMNDIPSTLSKDIPIIHEDIETQTSPRRSIDKSAELESDGKAPCDAGTCLIEHYTQTDDSLLPKPETIIKEVIKEVPIANTNISAVPSSTSAASNYENDDIVEENEVVTSIEFLEFVESPTKESLMMIPDLLTTMTPFLSQTYSKGDYQELKILLPKSTTTRNDKPLIWGLQIIHNFLTDSFIRSIHNRSKLSIESVFVDWLSEQYKLQHLVNQVVNDFSYLIINFSNDNLVKLFIELLESRFTFPQVCFLATIYSFSVNVTKPSYLEMLQGTTPNTNLLKIHIKHAFELIKKALNPKIADIFLANRASKDSPYIDYVDFLRQSAILFGDKHELLHAQAKNLLRICGCSDIQNIQNDSFNSFFCFLGLNNPKELKHDWKFVQDEGNSTSIQKLVSLCADKKVPLMRLLAIRPLASTVKHISQLPPLISTVYYHFINRFTETIPKILLNTSNEIREKTAQSQEDVKDALISVDLQRILWCYKQFLLKLEEMCLSERGFIPIAPQPNDQMIRNLIEYFDRSESVSFAFVNI